MDLILPPLTIFSLPFLSGPPTFYQESPSLRWGGGRISILPLLVEKETKLGESIRK